jgi:precorrin-6Y C5,15-methyltransferase (decarboxylating)
MFEIIVLGISADRLAAEHLEQLEKCYAVVCSKRFFPLVAGKCKKNIPVTPLSAMIPQVKDALKHGNVAVLASGDPLFYGIGRTLLEHFLTEQLRFFPALSALQLACARFKTPWDDTAVLSLHGRVLTGKVAKILGQKKTMLFTDGNNSPDRMAALLLDRLQTLGCKEQLNKMRVQVAENLGLADEKISIGSLAEIAAGSFSPLNMMLVEQDENCLPETEPFGLTEAEIKHSRGLITKDEVRAVVLHLLRLPPKGVFWDVGGGSGSIAVETARLCPELAVFTIEHKEEGQQNIRDNGKKFHLYSMELVCGHAPDVLTDLPIPDRVFIGGSGGELAAIIDMCANRLKPGGRMVASAVLQTTAELAPRLMRSHGLEVTTRAISVTRNPGDPDIEQQLNTITLITGKK